MISCRLTDAQMRQVWPPYAFPAGAMSRVLLLLEEFGIMRRFSSCFIVPSILRSTTVPLEELQRCSLLVQRQSEKCLTLVRVYRFEAFRPPGLMSQLVTRLLHMMNSDSDQLVAVWRVGVCCVVEDTIDGSKHCVQAVGEGDVQVKLVNRG